MIDNRVFMETIWSKLNHQIIQQIVKFEPHYWIFIMRNKANGLLILNLRNDQPTFSILNKDDSTLLTEFIHSRLTEKLKGFQIIKTLVETDETVLLELINEDQTILIRLQMAKYAPRFQLIQHEEVIFDSVLGWKPNKIIKAKPSKLELDQSLNLEFLIRHAYSISYLHIINKTLDRKLRRQDALKQDLQKHQQFLGYQLLAEAIQAEPNQAWDYYPNPNHLLPPHLNFKTDFSGSNLLFRLYKKAKKGIALTQSQLKMNQAFIDEIYPYTKKNTPLNSKDLGLLKLFLEKEHLLSGMQTKPTEVQHLSPHYVVYNGIRISFGKNAKQNDHLTFTIAKKNEIFMHIDGKSGSHVVIHHSQFDHDLIMRGAQLVLALAKQIAGTITYAKVGSLKQTKTPGLVIIKDAKTIKANADALFSQKLLETAKRY